jgi:hypothetical protein
LIQTGRQQPGLDEHPVIEGVESLFDPQVRKKFVRGDEASMSDLEARLPGIHVDICAPDRAHQYPAVFRA